MSFVGREWEQQSPHGFQEMDFAKMRVLKSLEVKFQEPPIKISYGIFRRITKFLLIFVDRISHFRRKILKMRIFIGAPVHS